MIVIGTVPTYAKRMMQLIDIILFLYETNKNFTLKFLKYHFVVRVGTFKLMSHHIKLILKWYF